MARPFLKASQRGRQPAIQRQPSVAPVREPGQPVRWKERQGLFHRDVGDGEHSEVAIDGRVYRAKTIELIG